MLRFLMGKDAEKELEFDKQYSQFLRYTQLISRLECQERFYIAEEIAHHVNTIEKELGEFFRMTPKVAADMASEVKKLLSQISSSSSDGIALTAILHACILMSVVDVGDDRRSEIRVLFDKASRV